MGRKSKKMRGMYVYIWLIPFAVQQRLTQHCKATMKVKVTQQSDSLQPRELYSPWSSPGQNTGVSSLSLLQGIFPTQGSNWGLLYCRQTLYQLNHQGSPNLFPRQFQIKLDIRISINLLSPYFLTQHVRERDILNTPLKFKYLKWVTKSS